AGGATAPDATGKTQPAAFLSTFSSGSHETCACTGYQGPSERPPSLPFLCCLAHCPNAISPNPQPDEQERSSTMNKVVQYGMMAGMVVVLLAGLQWAAPQWLATMGADTHDLPELLQQIETHEQTSEELCRHDTIIKERMVAKKQIVLDLIAGRRTLLEAAARFRDLNENPEDCRNPYREFCCGNSDGEKLGRQVITWVAGVLEGRSPEVVACLEMELQDLLASQETVVLPE